MREDGDDGPPVRPECPGSLGVRPRHPLPLPGPWGVRRERVRPVPQPVVGLNTPEQGLSASVSDQRPKITLLRMIARVHVVLGTTYPVSLRRLRAPVTGVPRGHRPPATLPGPPHPHVTSGSMWWTHRPAPRAFGTGQIDSTRGPIPGQRPRERYDRSGQETWVYPSTGDGCR